MLSVKAWRVAVERGRGGVTAVVISLELLVTIACVQINVV